MMAALLMGLTGCSNEDFPGADSNVPAGKPVAVTLTVGRGAEATRTTLTPEGLGLKDEWEGNEDLVVFNKDGQNIGTLHFQNYVNDDKKVGNFAGQVSANDGTEDYYVWYLGKNTDDKKAYATIESGTPDKVKIQLNNQSGKFEDLSRGDVMYGQTKITVADNKGTNANKISLTNALCMLRIDLGIKGGYSLSGARLKVKNGETNIPYTQNFACNGELLATSNNNTTLTIDDVDTNEDVYFALAPGQYTLNFELQYGVQKWTKALNVNNLIAGVYYTNLNESNPGGVNVELEGDKPLDHTLNPLEKWAEANLVYDPSTRTSSIAESEYEGGSLYQWGRNDGYEDYKDAMGGIDTRTGNYKYATYADQFYSGEGFSNPSTGMNRSSMTYSTAYELTTITKAMRLFFINPYSRYGGYEVYKDYWAFLDVDGGYSWETRATACGYTNDSPAPKGWKIPTKNDFKEIFPKEGKNWEGVDNLASEVNGNLIEVKTKEGVCKYAIRWDIESEYGKKILKIRALVVPDSFTKEMLPSMTWDEPGIKSRIFPATGAIEAYVRTHINSQNTEMNVVRPMPFGNWNVLLNAYPSEVNARYWAVQYLNIVDAGKTQEGSYWASDDTYIFRFRNNNGQFGAANPNSFIGASDQCTSNAFAIRCIRAE